MKPVFGVVLIVVGAFLPQVASSATKDDSTGAEALVARARSEEVRAEGTPPMNLKADIDVAGVNGTTAQGNYIFDWVSPTEWREEIKFANYERLRVRDAKGYWQKSMLDLQSMLAYEFSGMLHVKDVLKVRSVQALGKVKSRDRDGVRQSCVAVNWVKA